jgi:CheY-like chemotaxis protein
MNPGTHVMLVVSDTGCGMPEHVVERAFEPFFTTKEVGKGTGLGLSTVFGIVKQSGGTITVRSRPGEGSTFRVYLPACTVATVPDAVSAPAAAALGGLETILVVEDEPAARELLARVLKGRGYRVLQAESGRDVERTLADGERRPDLLLTDVVLPGGQTGRDVAEALLAQNPDLPVIFMSGYARDAMGREGKLDGGLDFLQKPFSPDTLLLKVRALLDGSVA